MSEQNTISLKILDLDPSIQTETTYQAAENSDVAEPEAEDQPGGPEADQDARLLDEIELSLRAMIDGNVGREHPERLSDVSRLASQEIAERRVARDVVEVRSQPADLSHESADSFHNADEEAEPVSNHQIATDVETVREAFRDPRTPPWLLSRTLDPEPIPEPVGEHWPQSRRRGMASRIFATFGLAAAGAAIVGVIAVMDVPSLIQQTMRGLSSNAAAVFNEGKASSLRVRVEAAQKETRAASSDPGMRYAVVIPPSHDSAVQVKTESISQAPERREPATASWPSPDQAKRSEPAGWQVTPSAEPDRAPAVAPERPRESASPTRVLTQEEIAVLRKMGDDYISSGDFVGARGVLERAAQAGDASAAFALASTYDPVVLARFKVRGLEPDIVKASFWYERARELGSAEAPHRLAELLASRKN